MSVIHTALSKVEASLTWYENRLEECRLREHKAQSRDQEQPDSQATDDVLVESSTEDSTASGNSPNHPDDSEAQPP